MVYTAAIESAKVLSLIGGFFLIIGKLGILKKYKIQQDDHIPWRKLPKVLTQVSKLNALQNSFCLLDSLEHHFQSRGCWNNFLEIHRLSSGAREKIQIARRCKEYSDLYDIRL